MELMELIESLRLTGNLEIVGQKIGKKAFLRAKDGVLEISLNLPASVGGEAANAIDDVPCLTKFHITALQKCGAVVFQFGFELLRLEGVGEMRQGIGASQRLRPPCQLTLVFHGVGVINPARDPL